MDEAELLDILGNENRRNILKLLSLRPFYVTEISERLQVAPKAAQSESTVAEFPTPIGDIQIKTNSLADVAETLDSLRRANRELMGAQRRVQALINEVMERGARKIDAISRDFVEYDILSMLLTGPKTADQLSAGLAIPGQILVERLHNLEKQGKIRLIGARTYWLAR